MKSVWSIGERIFRNNYKKRMKMYRALVQSIAMFGAEIWGWEEDERMEGIQRKYVKWILGFDRNIPNYIIEEECKLERQSMIAIKRALKFEEKARDSKVKLVKEAIREKDKDKERVRIGKESKKRREILKKEKVKETRYLGGKELKEEITEKILRNKKEKEKEERQQKLEKSRYNSWYKILKTEEEPEYLRKEMKDKERKLLARFRCGNECKGKEYWKEEKEKLCRLCEKEEENIQHVLKKCEATKGEKSIEEILNQKADGIEELRRIETIRKEKKKENSDEERNERQEKESKDK